VTRRPTIGVFDSGVGGLTVLRELVRLLDADYRYFGDTARLPYGSKSAETVARYAVASAQFLERMGAEMLVIACNTASALALDAIRSSVKIAVTGVIAPGAEQAAQISRTRHAVVIGTEATVSSHVYSRELARLGLQAREKACPLLVPLVEEGWTDHPVTEQVARIYLDELFAGESASQARDDDVLLLGCTHYPLLRPLLRRLLPPAVSMVDSAESTAHAVAATISAGGHPASPTRRPPALQFFATDSVEKFRRLGSRFLGWELGNVTHVDIDHG